ncbi:MAG: ABC transporter substrate-binding protein [Acidimicrobiia bacterium]
MKVSRRSSWTALTLAALALAACGGSDDAESESTTVASASAAEATDAASTDTDVSDATAPATSASATTAPGGEDTAAAEPTGTLRVYNDFGAGTWDAPLALGGPQGAVLSHVFDRVIHIDPTGAPIPGIAESWEFDDTNTVLTLTLREGLSFTDGTPLDGTAVAAALNRNRSVEGSTLAGLMSNIAEVEAIDPLTVQVTQNQPDVSLVLLLADRAGMIMSPSSFDDPDIAENPVGSGMFKLVSQDPDVKYILERNPDYWDAEAVKVAGVEWNVLGAAEARVSALQSGQADIVLVQGEQAALSEGLIETVTGPSSWVGMMQINPERVPAYADPRVRQAISHAIDRVGITESLLFGTGEPSLQLLPPGHWAYNDELDATGAYDPDLARELLAEAGFESGIVINAVVASPRSDTIATAIQAQLAEVGITVNLEPLPGTGAGQKYWTDKQTDAIIASFTGRPDPSIAYSALYTAPQFLNPGSLTTDEMTALIAQSKSTSDPDERATILRDVAALVAEDPLGLIPLWTDTQVLGISDEVEGLEVYVNTWINLEGVSLTGGS